HYNHSKKDLSSPQHVNKKKHPLSTVYSVSGQNKKFAAFGKQSENMLHYNNEAIFLNYQTPDKENDIVKLDAIVRTCDESLLSLNGYQSNYRIEITNLINKKIRIEIFNIDNINSDLLELDEVNEPVLDIIIKDSDIEN
ncbi:4656_t:CDS:2, partial [Cetraspora pellucida]